jgi:hypothetical protein
MFQEGKEEVLLMPEGHGMKVHVGPGIKVVHIRNKS